MRCPSYVFRLRHRFARIAHTRVYRPSRCTELTCGCPSPLAGVVYPPPRPDDRPPSDASRPPWSTRQCGNPEHLLANMLPRARVYPTIRPRIAPRCCAPPRTAGLPETGRRTRQRRKSSLAGGGLPNDSVGTATTDLAGGTPPDRGTPDHVHIAQPNRVQPTHAYPPRPTSTLSPHTGSIPDTT